jgi:uncharacterized protein GlcG (DUF336 family)
MLLNIPCEDTKMIINILHANQLKYSGFLVLIIFSGLGISCISYLANDAKATVQNSTLIALNTQHVIPLKLAQQLVAATQAVCADQGFPITVSVLDRDGIDILLARGDGATGASVEVARDKAYAAVGFNNPTSALEDRVETTGFGILTVEGFTVLPGGLPIEAGDELVGGIGVSGAPGGDIDEYCAEAGLEAIAPSLSSVSTSNLGKPINNSLVNSTS